MAAAVAAVYWFLWPANDTPAARLEARFGFVSRYCVDCHNAVELAGGLSLEGLRPVDVRDDAAIWEHAVRKLKLGMMPPPDVRQPDSEAKAAFVAALEAALDAAAESVPFALAAPVRRLNRSEYANAIRDLLELEIDVAELLPSDEGDFTFDDIGSALTTSPRLLESYLTAALRVADAAVGNLETVATASRYRIDVETTQKQHVDGLPLGTRGGLLIRHHFPVDADYVFSGRLLRTVGEGYVGVEGHAEPHTFIVTVDGEQVFSASVGGAEDHALNGVDFLATARAIDQRMTSPRIPILAGTHDIGFTWVERPFAEQNVWQPALRESRDAHNAAGLPRLDTAVIAGPYDPIGVGDTPSRNRIFVCQPASESDTGACARQIFTTLARRAFRRPVISADLTAPLRFYAEARDSGRDFDAGIRDGLARILISPAFLFRAERDPLDLAVGDVHEISDVELASRLSFFLWSSIPDDELLDLAATGRLRRPGVIAAQVTRMIEDSRANALVENFTGQWLQLRNLESRVNPDLLLFADFDDDIRKGFRTETELLFGHVLRYNRSVLELLDANYTFVNERLARHYGVRGVYGDRFRRVELDDPNRWGLLGHGSLLALTSMADRTSPILRGKYVVANLLNYPPPAPPAVVPALVESVPVDRPSTVREQLERHRTKPECYACHRNLDPFGFALENFDAVGKWRFQTRDGLEIDASGVLPGGQRVSGPIGLREAMLARPELFAGAVTEKLMSYALGRTLEPGDMPQVRRILRQAAGDDYRLKSIILGVIGSFPFQMRTKMVEPVAM